MSWNDPDIEMRIADAQLEPWQRTGRCPHCGYCHLSIPRENQVHRTSWPCNACRREWHCMFNMQYHLRAVHGVHFEAKCDACRIAWNRNQVRAPAEEMCHRCPHNQ